MKQLCKECTIRKAVNVFCSRTCAARHNGKAYGQKVRGTGKSHIRIRVKGRGRVYLHRLKIEQKLKRELSSGEIVHHKNENKFDNRLSNLKLLTGDNARAKHLKEHNYWRKPKDSGPIEEFKIGDKDFYF